MVDKVALNELNAQIINRLCEVMMRLISTAVRTFVQAWNYSIKFSKLA